jgi:hypothetical protein
MTTSDEQECGAETWSWWHFNDNQVDPYWIRCTEFGPHEQHEDANTGLVWEKTPEERTEPADPRHQGPQPEGSMRTMDLIEFLRGRLDEDEASVAEFDARIWDAGLNVTTYWLIDDQSGNLCVRVGKKRVLAEVDVKRRILDEVVDEATGLDMSVDGDRRVGSRDTATEPYLGTVLLRLLALPYADHPDYRDEWRPQVGDTRPD